MKLNLGCGSTPKKDFVNFDIHIFRRGEYHTDVVGLIQQIPFKDNSFKSILCSHVIEHFTFEYVPVVLQTIYNILEPAGIAVIEAPCILGGYDYYINKHNNIRKYLAMLYGLGPVARKLYTPEYAQHRSGWTGPLMAEQMEPIGFKIKYVGHGRTHGMGRRDFRVEGVKP